LQSAGAGLPRIDEITIDWRILLYTLGTALFVGVLCGIFPAIRAARHRMNPALGENERTTVSGRNPLQWFLVGAQVALSVMLLVSAGLLVRSIQQLSRVDPGFDIDRVLSFQISGTWGETANYDRLTARIDNTLQVLSALPGVEAAATATFLPGIPVQFESQFALAEASGEAAQRLIAETRAVAPEYFGTMRIPVVQGVPCRRQQQGATQNVMVNQAFVGRYLSTRSTVIGLHLASAPTGSRAGVITGVVGDAREAGLDRAPMPTVYLCNSAPNPTPYFLLRTRTEPQVLAHTVRLTIKELEPLRSVYDIGPLKVRVDGAFGENRFRAVLLGAFALTALSLAGVGLYGTLSYIVSRRRREVGLRLALGAGRSQIVRQFLLQALRAVGAACVVGLALSWAFTRLLTGMLYGVSSVDPFILSTVVAVVAAVGTLAALIPATRAAFLAPIEVLRQG
jgi:putative ABC transport system permease protein